VESALEPIEDSLGESVWYYDSSATPKIWKQYYVGNPDVVQEDYRLTKMEPNTAYWIYVTEDTTLVYGGTSYDLSEGWNNIAWRG